MWGIEVVVVLKLDVAQVAAPAVRGAASRADMQSPGPAPCWAQDAGQISVPVWAGSYLLERFFISITYRVIKRQRSQRRPSRSGATRGSPHTRWTVSAGPEWHRPMGRGIELGEDTDTEGCERCFQSALLWIRKRLQWLMQLPSQCHKKRS